MTGPPEAGAQKKAGNEMEASIMDKRGTAVLPSRCPANGFLFQAETLHLWNVNSSRGAGAMLLKAHWHFAAVKDGFPHPRTGW